MAFQNKNRFFSFLQEAAGDELSVSAPAENYILDERVPPGREDDFLSFNDFESVALDSNSWFKHHVDYAKERVALPSVSATFTSINRPNWLRLSPDWDVVRIETLCGMASRARDSALGENELLSLIEEHIDARDTGNSFDIIKEAQLVKWLQNVNRCSDRRPAFVAPFAEVEELLGQPDWANCLRDVLGLGHIRKRGKDNVTVLLMQYNLNRVHETHIGKPAWAASPTVLDDVPRQMPNPCFFPAPAPDSSNGYGNTIDLGSPWSGSRKEFLHGHIAYTLADIRRIGEVTTDVSDTRIADARKDHLYLLTSDLRHFCDLRAKP